MSMPVASNGGVQYIPQEIGLMVKPQVNLGVSSLSEAINGVLPLATPMVSVNPLQIWIFIGICVWVMGMVSLIIYSAVSGIRLKRRVNDATLMTDNVYETDSIDSPFVWGLIKPKIYLPVGLSSKEREYVLRHEQAHIARRDHLIKPLAYMALVIHWFNPFMWLAFVLMSRDMEMSCDERVIHRLNVEEKAGYSEVLLRLAINRPILAGNPLAFGESGTKGRIRNVLNYRKPSFWVGTIVIVAVAIVGVCLIANPQQSIFLPEAEAVQLLQIEQINEGESLGIIRTDSTDDIYAVLSALAGAKQSLQLSTNELPETVNYFTVKLIMSDEERIIHLYMTGQSYYIEEPYIGVFKSNRDTSIAIAKVYTSHDVVINAGIEYDFTKIGVDGEVLVTKSTLNEMEYGLAEEIIMDHAFKSAAWPGVDISSLSDYYLIRQSFPQKGEIVEYYVFLIVGQPVMQHGPDGFYSRIDDKLYAKFIELFKVDAVESGDLGVDTAHNLNNVSELDKAISKAIISVNRDSYEGDYSTEAHTVLGINESEHDEEAGDILTAYVVACYMEFDFSDRGIFNTSGGHMPVAITFEKKATGGYVMIDYWMPQDGSGYPISIKEKFPEELYENAIHLQNYIETHMQVCYEQAVAYSDIDIDAEITLLIEAIASSPSVSSNPQAYIEAHESEYRELIYYRNYTLRHCYAQFEQGGQTGLEGHIMAAVCRDILSDSEDIDIMADTGQEWYNEFKSIVQNIHKKNGDDYIEKNMPGAFLLLKMIEE